MTLAMLSFRQILKDHVWTVTLNTHVKSEIRSLNRFGAGLKLTGPLRTEFSVTLTYTHPKKTTSPPLTPFFLRK